MRKISKDFVKIIVFTLIITTFYVSPSLASEGGRIAILTTSEDWHYAMMASGLSAANGYPLLVTQKDALDGGVKKKIRGYNKVIIVGNEEVISTSIEDELNNLRMNSVPGYYGLEVERVGGEDIYETSILLVNNWDGAGGLIVTRGDIFPDTLVAGQLSAVKKAPIIFTKSEEIPPSTLDKIESLKLDVTIIGGTLAVSENVENLIEDAGAKVTRIGGANREETAAMVAENFIDEMNGRGRFIDTVVFVDRLKGDLYNTLGARSYVFNSIILFTGPMPEVNKVFLEAHPQIIHALILDEKGSKSRHPDLEGYLEENEITYQIDELDATSLSFAIAELVKELSIPVDTGRGIGQNAPNFQLTSIDGEDFSLIDFRGNVVTIYFMAVWCTTCIDVTKALKRINDDYADRGVVVIAIDVWRGETKEQLRGHKKKYGGNEIWALDTDDVGWKYKILTLGSTYIIDRNGAISYKDETDKTRYDTFAKEIEKVL